MFEEKQFAKQAKRWAEFYKAFYGISQRETIDFINGKGSGLQNAERMNMIVSMPTDSEKDAEMFCNLVKTDVLIGGMWDEEKYWGIANAFDPFNVPAVPRMLWVPNFTEAMKKQFGSYAEMYRSGESFLDFKAFVHNQLFGKFSHGVKKPAGIHPYRRWADQSGIDEQICFTSLLAEENETPKMITVSAGDQATLFIGLSDISKTINPQFMRVTYA